MKKATKSAVADIRFDDVAQREVLPAVRVELRTRAQFAQELNRLWQAIEAQFLQIGRRLNEAKDALEHGEFMELVKQDVPFTHSTANRLMRVAAAVDAGLLPAERLPPSYATVYELLTLSDEERQRALSEGLVRPDLKRAEVSEFKTRVRERPAFDERAMLEARRQRLLAELKEVEDRLSCLGG